jgi:predicted naringenin-chalcone synthase
MKKMNNPKIISLGYSTPPYVFDQKQVFQGIGYPRHWFRIFDEAKIDYRHFLFPIEKIKKLSFQEQQEAYAEWAVSLSVEAVKECLDDREVAGIGCFTYGSCTGLMPGPSASHLIANELKMSPVMYHFNIIGQGCESGYPNLKIASDYVQSSGKTALCVNCELCDLTYFPEKNGMDKEDDYSLIRANALFADAAVACLVGYDDDWHHPTIIDTEAYTDHAYIHDLGYRWQDGRLRAVISKRVPELAAEVIEGAVVLLLDRLDVKPYIKWWVIHAAGNAVIDNVRDNLGLSEEQVKLSRETLRLFGNTSSTSVGITGKRLMEQDIKQGDYVMMLSVGPGMTGGSTLLRFQ